MKKFLSIVLTLAIFCGIVMTTGFNGFNTFLKASAAEKKVVSSGENWELFDDGELQIKGNVTFADDESPWIDDAKIIDTISIFDGTTEIKDYAFAKTKAPKLYIPVSVVSIGENAFKNSGINVIYYEGTSEQWNALGVKAQDIPVNFEHTHANGEPQNAAEANCTTKGYTGDIYCTECDALSQAGKVIDEIHSWSEEKAVKAAATCKDEGVMAKYCVLCHAWDSASEEPIPKDEHKFEVLHKSEIECGKGTYTAKCSVCGYEKDFPTTEHEYVDEITEAGCETEGYTLHTCKYCKVCPDEAIVAREPALGHKKSAVKRVEPTCTKTGKEYVDCTRCGKIFSQTIISCNHDTYAKTKDPAKTEWKVTTKPTCKDEGEETLYCKECEKVITDEDGKDVTRIIEADITAHVPNDDWNIEQDASCLADGLKIKTCSVCGKEIAREAIPATGHKLIPDKEVSCTEGGTIIYTCENCDFTDEKVVEKSNEHDCVITVTEPTCTEKGYTLEKCKNCTYEMKYKETAALNHALETVTVKAATCTESGLQVDRCTREGCKYETNEKEIPVIEHTWVEDKEKTVAATCDTDGTAYYTCSVCKEEKAETIKHKGHVLKENTYDPNCENEGYTEHKCVNCGSAYKDTYKDALGHKWEEATVPATCTENGYKQRVCSVCKKSEVTEKDTEIATGHNFGDPEFIWSEDYKTCKVVFTCKNEKDYSEKYDCTVNDKITKEAACTEEGKLEFTAFYIFNGKSYSDTKENAIPAKGHVAVKDAGKDATCTEKGLTEGTHCSVCQEVIIAQEVINEKGHVAVKDAAKDATCTETGLTEGTHCSVCLEKLKAQEVIAALGHKPVTDAGKAATCTAEGLTDGSHCSVCEEILQKQEIIPKLPHQYGEEKVTKEASVFSKGMKEHTCKDCGYKESFEYSLTFLQKVVKVVKSVFSFVTTVFNLFSQAAK